MGEVTNHRAPTSNLGIKDLLATLYVAGSGEIDVGGHSKYTSWRGNNSSLSVSLDRVYGGVSGQSLDNALHKDDDNSYSNANAYCYAWVATENGDLMLLIAEGNRDNITQRVKMIDGSLVDLANLELNINKSLTDNSWGDGTKYVEDNSVGYNNSSWFPAQSLNNSKYLEIHGKANADTFDDCNGEGWIDFTLKIRSLRNDKVLTTVTQRLEVEARSH